MYNKVVLKTYEERNADALAYYYRNRKERIAYSIAYYYRNKEKILEKQRLRRLTKSQSINVSSK